MNVAESDRERILIEKIRSLPRDRWGEVEDFIDFVRMLDPPTAAALSEPAFAAIWDNPEDAENGHHDPCGVASGAGEDRHR